MVQQMFREETNLTKKPVGTLLNNHIFFISSIMYALLVAQISCMLSHVVMVISGGRQERSVRLDGGLQAKPCPHFYTEGPDQTVSRQVLNDAQIILRALYTWAVSRHKCLLTVRVPIPLSIRTAIVFYNVELCRVACRSKYVENALIKCEKVCVLLLWRNGVLSSTQTHVSAECK